jgi:hypothetical protein
VVEFTLRSEIANVSVVAVGRKIRDLRKIRKAFGKGRWRKLKGEALVALVGGEVLRAELHGYEAHGIGRRDMKIKRLLPR